MSNPTDWIEPGEGERERLYILIEELNEAQHIAAKVLRFGFDEVYPGTLTTNRARLEEELGDTFAMVEQMVRHDDVSQVGIEAARDRKLEKLKRYTRGRWAKQ